MSAILGLSFLEKFASAYANAMPTLIKTELLGLKSQHATNVTKKLNLCTIDSGNGISATRSTRRSGWRWRSQICTQKARMICFRTVLDLNGVEKKTQSRIKIQHMWNTKHRLFQRRC
jgi:hypothetical protein